MSGIGTDVLKIAHLPDKLEKIAKEKNLPSGSVIKAMVADFIRPFQSECWVHLDSPYVDRLYRDSYYHHYASKHLPYYRDCLRVCFFKESVDRDFFYNYDKAEQLQSIFLGYLVIRPTEKPIGRNVISPEALNAPSFLCCLARSETLVGGTKLVVHGFPHTSQDSITHTCAETTIWSVMEYYSSRYPDYPCVLPSAITRALADVSFSRMVPSDGLTIYQISKALSGFGFGTKVYSSQEQDFMRTVRYYVESGIPIIAGLKNNNIGHAIVVIGHQQFALPTDLQGYTVSICGFSIVDTADLPVKYVVIDDNIPPYSIIDPADPVSGRADLIWQGAKITSIVVPLYPRIFLEAKTARKLLTEILDSPIYGLQKSGFRGNIVLRFFLTSTRSFKFRLTANTTLKQSIRQLLIATRMPKFVWIAELSSEAQYRQGKVGGMVVIDATGKDYRTSIISLIYPNGLLSLTEDGGSRIDKVLVPEFNQYKNNLKGAWCGWKS
ncbi:MAG: hypothetical protein KDK30_03140 [Leptospiraceae bacterium]|nr:hypothetical protein [Leptospiraceae bacterium]